MKQHVWKYLNQWIAIFCMTLMLVGCHQKNNDTVSTGDISKENTITVEKKRVYKKLYFSGILTPSQQISVISPNDGVVIKKFFHPGQLVKKGQLLFIIQSRKQADQFQQAFANYLKAKQQLNSDQGKLQSTTMLYKKGLVSHDDYEQARNNYYLSDLGLIQSQNELKKILQYYQFNQDVFKLSISDIKSISETMAKSQKAEQLHIMSPANGVSLLPITPSDSEASQTNSDPSAHGINVGSQIKQGEVLTTIGILQGLAMQVKANEININQLTVGLPVKITSVAFPGVTLQGKINAISAQAVSSNSLPVFNVQILIPTVTAAQLQVIRIGMSAKAIVNIQEPDQISIPINAVFENKKTGETAVTRIANGKSIVTPVQTGETTLNSVIILSGLNPGDIIVSRHPAQ